MEHRCGCGRFDSRWLPSARSDWLWFAGMTTLIIVTSVFVSFAISLSLYGEMTTLNGDLFSATSPAAVLLRGVVLVLVAPIAEEIFWRVYLLAQLERISAPGASPFSIQSLLFAFAHLPSRWLPFSAFFVAMILGTWRVRFRSLIPLVLAHIILNGAAAHPAFRGSVRDSSECLSEVRGNRFAKNHPSRESDASPHGVPRRSRRGCLRPRRRCAH